MKKTKIKITGVMTLFILTAINPIFSNAVVTTASADESWYTIDVSKSEAYVGEHFTVSALTNDSALPVSALITYNDETKTDNPSEFNAVGEVNGQPIVKDEEMQIKVEFIDAGIIKYESITVKPNEIFIEEDYTTNDAADSFEFYIRDALGEYVFQANAYASWGEEDKSNLLGKAVFKDIPVLLEDEQTKTFDLTVYKAGYGDSVTSTIYVENKNVEPDKPEIEGKILTMVGENNVYDYSFAALDPDGNDVKYKYKWSSKINEPWKETDLVSSGSSVTLSHYWESTGVNTISAKTVDENGKESSTRDILTVTVTNTMPETPSLEGPRYIHDDVNEATFNACTSDKEGHNILYHFNANNIHKESKWEPDNTACIMTINGEDGLKNGNIYNVRVKATDQWKKEKDEWSDWSGAVRLVKGNIAPNTPAKPEKSGRGTKRTFTFSTTDANLNEDFGGPDMLWYLVDFGDGTDSGWLGGAQGCNIGLEMQVDHDYIEQEKLIKFYKVRVKAKDEHGAESAWSDPCIIIVFNKNKIKGNSGIPIKIDPKTLPQGTINMIPKNSGIEGISLGYNYDGTYDIYLDGTPLKQGLNSPEAVQNYISNLDNPNNPGSRNGGENTGNQDTGDETTDDNNQDTGDGSTDGNNQDTENTIPEENPIDPNADIDGPSSGDINETLSFDGSDSNDPDGSIEQYDWYYKGYWHNNIGSSISITYPDEGYKTIKLRVHDNDRNTDTDYKQVEITEESDRTAPALYSTLNSEVEEKDINKYKTLDLTIQFNGSGSLVYNTEKTYQDTQTNNKLMQTQSSQNQKTYKKSTGIYHLIQSLVKIFPSLNKIKMIKNIVEETDEAKKEKDVDSNVETPIKDIVTKDPEENRAISKDPESKEDPDNKNSIIPESQVFESLEEENIVFLWDFGDGEFGTGIKPKHTYKIDAESKKSDTTQEAESSKAFSLQSFDIYPIEKEVTKDNNKKSITNTEEKNTNTEETNSDHASSATYIVRLYIIKDEKDVLKDTGNIDKNKLNQVEIIDQDTTSITIDNLNESILLEQKPQKIELGLISY